MKRKCWDENQSLLHAHDNSGLNGSSQDNKKVKQSFFAAFFGKPSRVVASVVPNYGSLDNQNQLAVPHQSIADILFKELNNYFEGMYPQWTQFPNIENESYQGARSLLVSKLTMISTLDAREKDVQLISLKEMLHTEIQNLQDSIDQANKQGMLVDSKSRIKKAVFDAAYEEVIKAGASPRNKP